MFQFICGIGTQNFISNSGETITVNPVSELMPSQYLIGIESVKISCAEVICDLRESTSRLNHEMLNGIPDNIFNDVIKSTAKEYRDFLISLTPMFEQLYEIINNKNLSIYATCPVKDLVNQIKDKIINFRYNSSSNYRKPNECFDLVYDRFMSFYDKLNHHKSRY